MSKERNFVHKHSIKFNKPKVHVDRKKEEKRGKAKHKTDWRNNI